MVEEVSDLCQDPGSSLKDGGGAEPLLPKVLSFAFGAAL